MHIMQGFFTVMHLPHLQIEVHHCMFKFMITIEMFLRAKNLFQKVNIPPTIYIVNIVKYKHFK